MSWGPNRKIEVVLQQSLYLGSWWKIKKQQPVDVCGDFLDKQWQHISQEHNVYSYEVEIKAQSSQCKIRSFPWPKKARQYDVKVILTVFFYYKEIFDYEFLSQDQTVNRFLT